MRLLWGSTWLLDSNFDTHFSGSHDASLTLSEGYVETCCLSPRYRCRGHDRQLAVAASPFVRTRLRQVARPCDGCVKCNDGRPMPGSRTVHTDSTVHTLRRSRLASVGAHVTVAAGSCVALGVGRRVTSSAYVCVKMKAPCLVHRP